ncbi:snake venom 5'-nucleotidase-like isoform X1 [Montipora foliosa]|uniref:snake venom 5'-nucleotidase-like isoform X1 n=1 Tax=Montipora foliosa TaxID=591990 RepID=UPI0035F1C25B
MLALMFVFSFLFSSVNGFSLTVLHTNDNHGRFEETDTHGFMCFPNDAQTGKCFGGMARRATIIKQIRSQEKNVLLLSGGDVLTGTLWYTVYRGNATRDFMNELGYDAMALGNHEFDDGIDNLVAFLNGLNFTVVSSNLNVSQEPKWPRSPPLFVRSKVLEVGGQKIGIVGYVLENTPLYSRPGPGPNSKFLPEVESVRSAVEELKQNNINKIIAVGHSGIEMDKRVAREVDGVDIVVGGHTNTFLYTGEGTSPSSETPYGPYPLVISKDGNPESKALVVQDFAYGKYLGRLKVEFDDNGRVISWSGNPILLDSKIQKDPIVYTLVQQMKGPVAKVSEVKVGSSFVFLDARRPDCFLKECNLGNVVTDAFVFHYANQSANNGRWTDASIAIQSSGSITASIDVSAKDAVTYGHIVNSCPYKNTVDVVELKGKHLLQVFEQVASLYDENKPRGSFLQVSGLQITYDLAKASGERVVDIKVRCATCQIPVYKPLNESAIYKVILSSYLARGGAGFGVITRNKLSHRVGSVVDNVVVMNYFKAKSPILTGIEGRIKFIQGDHSVICSLVGNLSLSVAVTFVAIFSPFVMRVFVEP